MLSSQDLQFFRVVVATNSFAAASRQLCVTPPAVTQRLRAIEDRLGVRLVHRSSRGFTLTDEGELLAERAGKILAELDEVADLLGNRRDVVRGHLRVAASLGFGRRHVAPALASFRQQHPGVRITLQLSDHPVRVRPEAWDIIIHIGELPSMDLQRVPLAPNDRVLCGSPDYFARRGVPTTPAELATHDCLALQENEEDVTLWRFVAPDGAVETVRVTPTMVCNDGDVARSWALAGLGLIIRSEWDVAGDLKAGRLVRALPDRSPQAAPVVALVGARAGRAMRTSEFLNTLRMRLQPVPWRE